MRRAKQLLPYRGRTLVEHAANEALAAGFDPVVVVVGSHAQEVRARLVEFPVNVVDNPDWESGMGSSISVGVNALAECDGAAILLVDQPLVTAGHLLSMRGSFAGEIVAARYKEHLGVPAIFPKRLFGALRALHGHEGARSLLRSPDEAVVAFDLPEAAMDIDTEADWAAIGENR